MGDRTNIAVTQSHLTPKGAECGYVAVVPLAGGGWLCMKCGASGLRADHNTSDDLAAEARRLLDAATPGPWTHPSPTANWFTTPQPIQIDEADWGQETQEGGAMCGYRIGTLADERAWRYADVELIAAAPTLITDLLAERDAAVARADKLEAAIGIGDGIEWSVSLTVLRELAVRYPSWASDLTICEGLLRRIELAANDATADRGTDR